MLATSKEEEDELTSRLSTASPDVFSRSFAKALLDLRRKQFWYMTRSQYKLCLEEMRIENKVIEVSKRRDDEISRKVVAELAGAGYIPLSEESLRFKVYVVMLYH